MGSSDGNIPLKPGQKAVMLEMTDERRKRIAALGGECIDRIRKATESPLEAFFVIHFMKMALESACRCTFDNAIIINESDLAKETRH
jgi:hypothetical protein